MWIFFLGLVKAFSNISSSSKPITTQNRKQVFNMFFFMLKCQNAYQQNVDKNIYLYIPCHFMTLLLHIKD